MSADNCLSKKGVWQMMPESGSVGLLGNSTALNRELWSLSGPAAASAGSPGVVARDTVPTVPTSRTFWFSVAQKYLV